MKNLSKCRGKVIITKDWLFNDQTNKKYLKAIFSNFYPCGIEPNYSTMWDESLLYYGYSEFFREVEDYESTPQYEMRFASKVLDDEEIITFDGVNEITN
jgi:hypothetical protein